MPHGTCATYAADAVLGYSKGYMTWADGIMPAGMGVPPKAVHLRNLGVCCDNLMSSITHFYHLAAPSYIQGPAMPPWTPWFDDSDYHPLLQNPGGTRALPVVLSDDSGGFSADLWSAVITQYVKALRMRRLVFEASALFVGRTPFVSHLVAGGVTCEKDDPDFKDKCDTFKDIMTEVGTFIYKEYVPLALALGALYPGYDTVNNNALYNTVFGATGSNCLGWGGGLGNYLAWGNYPQPDDSGTVLVKGGSVDALGTPDVWLETYSDVDDAIDRVMGDADDSGTGLREYITYSRYKDTLGNFADDSGNPLNWAYPGDVTATEPHRDKLTAYTYLKAPRFDGLAREVGPLARLFVNSIFQNNVALATTVNPAGIVGYTAYVNTDHALYPTVTGLRPSMIAADLAVALAREGLATLTDDSGNLVSIAGLNKSQIAAAYTDALAITGPVAQWVIGLKAGKSTMDRIRARALEALVQVQFLNGSAANWNGGWIAQLKALQDTDRRTYNNKPVPVGKRTGFGCIEAPRGALAHFSTIENGKITAYQCVVPYTWNGSPRAKDVNDVGATESALVGVPFDNRKPTYVPVGAAVAVEAKAGGIEVLRVCQSFDPCIACAVH